MEHKDNASTYKDLRRYTDDCWNINGDTMFDIKVLIIDYINEALADFSAIDIIEDIATNGTIQLPEYIIQLAKASVQVAVAGAAFDIATNSLKEGLLKAKAKNKKDSNEDEEKTRIPTLIPPPSVGPGNQFR